MTAASRDPTGLVDLAGRIMLTHAIDPGHVMRVLGIDRPEAEEMIRMGRLWAPLGVVRRERLQLFVNILVRLEWRFQHESCAIRLAMETSMDALGGVALTDLLGGTLNDLRLVRLSVDTIEAPKVKWWRVGH